jgi:hypothetical protein
VTLTAGIYATGTKSLMGFDVAGPTPMPPSDQQALALYSAIVLGYPNVPGYKQGSWVGMVTGLSPGSYTFTAKYRSNNGGGVSAYENRQIIVTPVP